MLQLVILELPKLPEKAGDLLWPWLKFFKCKTREEYEMLATQYPELEKPIFCVRKMSLLEKWRDIQFHKNLWKEDERMRELYVRTEGREEGLNEGLAKGLAEGLAEGHAQGLTEGRTNEKLEIARKMKKSGRPLSEITEFTGLSVEAVETLP